MSRQTVFAILPSMRTAHLLGLHGDIMNELRNRGVVKTSNNPTGDYAESLFQRAFDWTLQRNSAAGYDATGNDGIKYQIKSRRRTKFNDSRQLGAIRNLDRQDFHCLAAVIFDEDYSVSRAIIIPRQILSRMRSRYSEHVNATIFHLTDEVWRFDGIVDVTEELRSAAAQL